MGIDDKQATFIVRASAIAIAALLMLTAIVVMHGNQAAQIAELQRDLGALKARETY